MDIAKFAPVRSGSSGTSSSSRNTHVFWDPSPPGDKSYPSFEHSMLRPYPLSSQEQVGLLFTARFVQPSIDLGNLCDPLPALPMLQGQDVEERPVKMIGDIGYLLVQAFEGVAYAPPARPARSTSNSPLQ